MNLFCAFLFEFDEDFILFASLAIIVSTKKWLLGTRPLSKKILGGNILLPLPDVPSHVKYPNPKHQTALVLYVAENPALQSGLTQTCISGLHS